MDVVIAGQGAEPRTRLWLPVQGAWPKSMFPGRLSGPVPSERLFAACFGVLTSDGIASLLTVSDYGDSHSQQVWQCDGTNWQEHPEFFKRVEAKGPAVFATRKYGGHDGFLLRDLDGDGRCELIVGQAGQGSIHQWSETDQQWEKLAYTLPNGTSIVDAEGR